MQKIQMYEVGKRLVKIRQRRTMAVVIGKMTFEGAEGLARNMFLSSWQG